MQRRRRPSSLPVTTASDSGPFHPPNAGFMPARPSRGWSPCVHGLSSTRLTPRSTPRAPGSDYEGLSYQAEASVAERALSLILEDFEPEAFPVSPLSREDRLPQAKVQRCSAFAAPRLRAALKAQSGLPR